MHNVHEQWNITQLTLFCHILLTRQFFQPKIQYSRAMENQIKVVLIFCVTQVYSHADDTTSASSNSTIFTSNGTLYNLTKKVTSSKHVLKCTHDLNTHEQWNIKSKRIIFCASYISSTLLSRQSFPDFNNSTLTSNGASNY